MPLRGRTLGGWGGRATKVVRATESVSISRKSPITTIANYNKKKPHSEEHGYNRGLRSEKTPIAACDQSD